MPTAKELHEAGTGCCCRFTDEGEYAVFDGSPVRCGMHKEQDKRVAELEQLLGEIRLEHSQTGIYWWLEPAGRDGHEWIADRDALLARKEGEKDE